MTNFINSINYEKLNAVILEAAKAFRILCPDELHLFEDMMKKYLKAQTSWAENAAGGYDQKEMDKFLSSVKIQDEDPEIYPLNGDYYRYRISFGELYTVVISIMDYYSLSKGYSPAHSITCKVVE